VATLEVDGKAVGSGHIDTTLFGSVTNEGLDIGQDLITPVSDDHIVPAKFTGWINSVTLTVK
jgi:hypothetical protein